MPEHEPTAAPPTGEQIHFPHPSAIPLLNALGVAITLLGVTFHWVVLALGLLLFLVTLVIWIRDTAREIDELPLEHH